MNKPDDCLFCGVSDEWHNAPLYASVIVNDDEEECEARVYIRPSTNILKLELLGIYNDDFAQRKINYCPMCGKQLTYPNIPYECQASHETLNNEIEFEVLE